VLKFLLSHNYTTVILIFSFYASTVHIFTECKLICKIMFQREAGV